MNLPYQIDPGYIGLGFVLLFLLLILTFTAILREKGRRSLGEAGLREIPAFKKLWRTMNYSVESGKRLHLTLGRAGIAGEHSTSSLVGLSILQSIAQFVSMGDRSPITTSGEGTLMILSQDTTRNAYSSSGVAEKFDQADGQLSGLTPFSYASGTLPIIYDQQTSGTIMAGHFGSEAALIADASENTDCMTLAGSDDLSAQAILLATANEPLIGEELYAAGAYMQTGVTHTASVRAQDVLRWILVIVILVGAALKLTGVI